MRFCSFISPCGALIALGVLALGCGIDVTVFGPNTPGEGGGGEGGMGPDARADKVDILLTIDNSRSMSDKQGILAQAVPGLLDAFINPACVDESGVPSSDQPDSPDDECPAGTERVFAPRTDIHIGVITTSLGGHGADACSGTLDPSEDDEAHLIDRGPTGSVETYDDKGFLAWDPNGELDPPGISSRSALEESLGDLVIGAGQLGCGYEATLEAWYRFLVDPDPYANVSIQNAVAVLSGTDNVVLEQRRDFLRPDSLLTIIVLSDENDCSIRDGGQYYFAAQIINPENSLPYRLPKPRAACADDPNDECCRSCGQAPAPGCSDIGDDCTDPLAEIDDHVNLRCYDQKRRFGIDFLQPLDRYVTALRQPQIADREGNIVPNPIFSEQRDERLIFLSAIVGVPWQDVARQRSGGLPDLDEGLDADGVARGGFQSPEELENNGTWQVILGDPSQYHTSSSALPDDPLMYESVVPRTGQNPITMQALAPPGASANANAINGHEYTVAANGDLQYVCVFPLETPRDCTDMTHPSCDCKAAMNDNPLCQDPSGAFTTTQYRAKAYPGLRHLQVVQALGAHGIIGSICPGQLDAPALTSFGYQASVAALVEAVQPILTEAGEK